MEKEMELKYLKSLAKLYPSVAAASTEIINLQSVLNLPKGTEHFMTDIHGEYEQFFHVLKNGSGSVKKKINEEFGNTLSKKDKSGLATLIYYPELKVDLVEKTEENLEDWYKITLHRLIQICKRVASKYTRAKVRKTAAPGFCLCHRGAHHGKGRASRQGSLLQCDYQHDHPGGQRPGIYHRFKQPDPASGRGPHPYRG